MFRIALPLAALMAFVCSGCVEYAVVEDPGDGELAGTDARIEVAPDTLDFGSLVAGEALSQQVEIHSVGNETLYIEDLWIDGPVSYSLDDADLKRILAPGSTTTIEVTYAPLTDELASGLIHVLSSDPTAPDTTVDLVATGLAPMIQLNPATFDFGDDEIGCMKSQEIEIWNMGSAPLVIEDVLFAPTSSEMLEEHWFPPGTTVDPGQMQVLTIDYDPVDELPDTGYLHVYSNDPAHPDALATQFGTAHLAGEVVDEHEQQGNNWTDILFVVDNSCSMEDEQNSLALNFSAFLDIVEVLDIDYHIAVVTTDTPYFQGMAPIMTPSTPNVEAAFADAVNVGTNGDWIEMGYEMSAQALTPPLAAPGGANDGFLREDAGLRVIYVSDEEDQSPDTVTHYVQLLQGLKTNPDHVVLSAIADPANSARYQQGINATDGIFESIANPNWVNTLSNLAWLSLSWQDTFELSHAPVVETIRVEINGVPVYSGWIYDLVINAVIFDGDYIPDTGDLVTIRYNLLGSCEG